jgi:hypothetical protein
LAAVAVVLVDLVEIQRDRAQIGVDLVVLDLHLLFLDLL